MGSNLVIHYFRSDLLFPSRLLKLCLTKALVKSPESTLPVLLLQEDMSEFSVTLYLLFIAAVLLRIMQVFLFCVHRCS